MSLDGAVEEHIGCVNLLIRDFKEVGEYISSGYYAAAADAWSYALMERKFLYHIPEIESIPVGWVFIESAEQLKHELYCGNPSLIHASVVAFEAAAKELL